MCLCTYVHMSAGVKEGRKTASDYLEMELLELHAYEPPDIDAGNQIWVFCKSNART